jgi:catechol 2,3-dioxygenase-like lactoylglutathione lyase family enzyme
MTSSSVNALCAVEIGVPDLEATIGFYEQVWGLSIVERSSASCYLRATGADYYVLALHRRDAPDFVRVRLGAQDRRAVDGLFERVAKAGGAPISAPGAVEAPGGGYGFAFRDPEGREVQISCDAQRHADCAPTKDRPIRLSHVVFNSLSFDGAAAFLQDALGFRLRDRTRRANFMGCNADHHCIAFIDRKNSALSHVAYELPSLDAVLRGCGRLKRAGLQVEWGVGRHGTGDNVFAYFVDANNFVIEYTAEMQQVDDATYVPGTPETITRPSHADVWGLAGPPSERFLRAAEGQPRRGPPADAR